jgi:hypothetical protein
VAEAFGGANACESWVVDGARVANGFGEGVVSSRDGRVLLLEAGAEVSWEVGRDKLLRDVGGPWCLSAG